MINNSNYFRWDRLNTKNLDQQFVRLIIDGLNCSPFEASAVLDAVYDVFGNYFDSSDSLKHGQGTGRTVFKNKDNEGKALPISGRRYGQKTKKGFLASYCPGLIFLRKFCRIFFASTLSSSPVYPQTPVLGELHTGKNISLSQG